MPAPAEIVPSGLLTSRGERIALGRRIGRGGEGTVYAVAGRADVAAKLLHEPMSADRAGKITALARLREGAGAALDAAAAFPLDLLKDDHGRPRGLLMPLVSGHRELHELYGPKSRIMAFPAADAAFLLGAAANLARAVALVHHVGCVIGDVNHASVLVSPRGTVRLIDCDSFQVRDGQKLLTCDVGQALFTPPELQGQALRGRERTPDHDAFGLAVLLFLLLFMGRHPFAGRRLGPGDMSIEKAIAERRFAYGPGARARGMDPPPNTLPIDAYGEALAALFERAFTAGESDPRPGAREWAEALGAAYGALARCPRNERHVLRKGLAACPFCAAEDATGAFLFGFGPQDLARERSLPAAEQVKAAWDAVCRITSAEAGEGPDFDGMIKALSAPPTQPARLLSPAALRPSTRGDAARGLASFLMAGGAGLALVGFAVATSGAAWGGPAILGGAVILVSGMIAGASAGRQAAAWTAPPPTASSPPPAGLAARRAEQARQVTELRRAWAKIDGWERDLASARRQVEALVRQWDGLPQMRRDALAALAAKDHERQLARYLNRFAIAGAGIPGIGPSRTATLQSYGIWTAGDATDEALESVPGFGPQLTATMRLWRMDCAEGFTPGPPAPPDPAELAQIERAVSQEGRRLAAEIAKAPAVLEAARRRVAAERARVRGKLRELQAAASA